MRPVAAPLVLALLLMAGCSSSAIETPDSSLGGSIDQEIVEPPAEEGTGASQTTVGGKAEAAPGNGEIRGIVLDDAGLPVANALVSLLGTEQSDTTATDGGFGFTNVTSGEHTLRVNPQDVFRVHEGKVKVVADRITQVTITLVPLDGRGPGYRPHLHDYWGDKQELPLLDFSLDWARSGACSTSFQAYGPAGEVITGVYEPNNSNWWVCFSIPEGDSGLPPIVLPGTRQLRFTFTWDDGDVDIDALQLSYRSASMDAGKWIDLEAVAKDTPVTFDLEAQEPDNGHQMFSLWQFRIRPQPRATPMTILGPIGIQAFAVRGDLPVDPPHEDFWGANTTYLSRSWDPPAAGTTICCNNFHHVFGMDSKRLVPPGTETLSVRFGWASNRAPGTPHDFDWDLLAKPAHLPPGAPLSDYVLLTPAKVSPGLKEYVVPVAPAETDAFYQIQSNWKFSARQAPYDLPEAAAETEHKFWLEVISNKDPAFT